MRMPAIAILAGFVLRAGAPEDLFNGHDLSGWEVVGDGVWSAAGDGILSGQCDLRKPCRRQSWLYTRAEFGEFDLKLQYVLRLGGNSGISIWDTSRGRYAVEPDYDGKRTPSHVGYEINIDNDALKDLDVTGSIYLVVAASSGVQRMSSGMNSKSARDATPATSTWTRYRPGLR